MHKVEKVEKRLKRHSLILVLKIITKMSISMIETNNNFNEDFNIQLNKSSYYIEAK
jgi:hypothetical protein